MQIILNNPYRITGLLVGVPLKDQTKQINRLKKFIEAEQDVNDDFSFPVLGLLNREINNITNAASKLNLDSDKINAALFWFFSGNSITDEPAFDYLKEENLSGASEIWTKLVQSGGITPRNFSAYQNLSTLLLYNAFKGSLVNINQLEQGISLKLKFIESDYIKDFKQLATDETFKTSINELQLLFLDQIQLELKNRKGTANKLTEILVKQDFLAKGIFFKTIVEGLIATIDKYIGEAKVTRKQNEANALSAGKELYEFTNGNYGQLKSILDTTSIQFSSISDKVSEEILQCTIDHFTYYKESDSDPGVASMDLILKAKSFAIGNTIKNKFADIIAAIQEWIDDKPQRDKFKLIKEDFEFIENKLQSFQNLSETVSNAKEMVDSCKPKIQHIKKIFGASDKFYLNLSNAIVQNAQNMLVEAVNTATNSFSNNIIMRSSLDGYIKSALDITFNLGTFDMLSDLRLHYNKNLESIKSLAQQLNISTLSPKEKLQQELRVAENKLREIQSQVFFKAEINSANSELNRINEWQFMRSQADKDKQVNNQKTKINQLLSNSNQEKTKQIQLQERRIYDFKIKIQQSNY